ncbi:MAG: UDP-2,3-diacylglucosamine diphosphatase [Alphaproteobacteria bacterium]
MNAISPRRQYRTVWISDVHLGTRGCQAELLLDFLSHIEAQTLYLVGDIVDGWRLRRSWYWPPSHDRAVREILGWAARGRRVVFVPGNHDEFLRPFHGRYFHGIQVLDADVHQTADGRRLLVLHGDQFDGVVRCHRWLALLGDHAYGGALALNRWFNALRRRLGFPYWSLSAFLKLRVKEAVQVIARFETAVAGAARQAGVDGVVCGHIHHAEMRMMDGVLYCNDGDWVESCTALVEHLDGRLEILDWPRLRPQRAAATTAPRGRSLPQAAVLAGFGISLEEPECAFSSSPMPGFLRSMASSER